ncbi:RNA-binding domain-containing protein [Backusella circina FSU 941]|nr:RNA-binding domain-containing protein [Backusella circina FSU 941]
MSSIDPSQTLYITNINTRITVEEIKQSLYGLFTTYGTILGVSAKKTEKMREQAFVVFSDIASATTAKRSLNGFTFFGQPLKIDYAKTKSHVVAMAEGTFRFKSYTDKNTSVALGKRAADDEGSENAKQARREYSDDDDSDDHA